VHLVTRGHFRSRDKDVGHTNQSDIAENPTLHANFTALCVIEAELLLIEDLRCGSRNFRRFLICDLDLDPITFIYELDPYFLQIHRMSKNKPSIRQGFRKLSLDR